MTENYNQSQLPNVNLHKFPQTRYQGSKHKLANWIFANVNDLYFESVLDAFGGTGAVAYKFKYEGHKVTYNDLLRFNFHFGRALIDS